MVFAVVLTLVAILSKVIGCGLGARMMGFQTYDAISIGLGMVSRGEVALIVAQKGAQAGPDRPNMSPPIVLVVIVTTLIHTDSAQDRHAAADAGEYRAFGRGGGNVAYIQNATDRIR